MTSITNPLTQPGKALRDARNNIASARAPILDKAGLYRYNRGPLNEWDLCLINESIDWYDYVRRTPPRPYCCRDASNLSIEPPWINMPFEAVRFNRIASLPVAGNFTGLDIQLQFQGLAGPMFSVDNGFDGIITEVVLDIVSTGATGFVQASGDVTWRIGVDLGQTINTALWYFRDYGNVQTSIGELIQPSQLGGNGGLRIISGQRISIFTNLAPGAIARINPNAVIIGSITGWTYPR